MILEEVADATYRLEVRIADARYIFAVYLLGGEKPVLIDPGPSIMIPHILEAMAELGMPALSVIIPTHIRMDHGGGAGSLAQLFPRAKVVVHPKAAKHAINPTRLIASTKIAYSDGFEDTYGPILPINESQLEVAEDGHVIHEGNRPLRIIHTPGHAFHHMSVYDEKTKGLFCGEALGLPASNTRSAILPSISVGDLDVDRYLESIEKLDGLQPQILYYPHDGGVRKTAETASRITANTVLLRDTILHGFKAGLSVEGIEEQVRKKLSGLADGEERSGGLASIILGYEAWYRRKGLL